QSALLEVMQEQQVSIAGESHPVPAPFVVMATQNPIESEGVYQLPEAQRDRFLMKVVVDYPTLKEEVTIVDRMSVSPPHPERLLTPAQLVELQHITDAVFVHPAAVDYAARLVQATRDPAAAGLPAVAESGVAVGLAAIAAGLTAGGGVGVTSPSTAALLPGSRQDPEGLLRKLELSVTRRLDGLLQGDYRGLIPGPGTEADDARPYEPGDDVRRIDWPLTARSGTPHVRNTIADRELEAWAVVDGSASMEFGTATCTKRHLAIAAVAALGFLTARGGNRVGAMVLTGGRPRIVPPRSGRPSLMALLHTVAVRPATGDGTSVDLADGIRRAGQTARRAGLVAVISDFLCPSDWSAALRSLAVRGHVIAIEI